MEAWAAAVESAKQVGSLTEPAFTWNLILTAVVGFMVWSLKRKVTQADSLKDRVMDDAIKRLEASIVDWQTGAKERTASLCKKIDDIAKDVKDKVPFAHCHDQHSAVKEDIKELRSKMFT